MLKFFFCNNLAKYRQCAVSGQGPEAVGLLFFFLISVFFLHKICSTLFFRPQKLYVHFLWPHLKMPTRHGWLILNKTALHYSSQVAYIIYGLPLWIPWEHSRQQRYRGALGTVLCSSWKPRGDAVVFSGKFLGSGGSCLWHQPLLEQQLTLEDCSTTNDKKNTWLLAKRRWNKTHSHMFFICPHMESNLIMVIV